MRNNQLTLQLIRCILIQELCMDPNRITIYNQKFIIPKTKEMFIYLESRSASVPISSRDMMDVNNIEHQDSNWLENVTIGIYSRDTEALRRKEEVAMALHSIYGQQVQEQNSFKIFRNMNIVPINEQEGTARLYRFDLECRVHAWYSVTKVAEFFDSFGVQVWIEGSTPLTEIEFVIPDTNPTVYPQ